MATKISFISREAPADMIRGLSDGLLADLREEGVGRVLAATLTIDDARGRAIVDIVGEVCEGEIALRIFTGYDLQASANDWLAEENIGEIKTALVRADGRALLLLAGRRD